MTDRTAPALALFLPGASLMEVRQLALDMWLVRCPGCGASEVYTASSAAQSVFLHESAACPVRERVKTALTKVMRR